MKLLKSKNPKRSETAQKIIEAMSKVRADLIKHTKEKNSELVVMIDGEIKYIKPE